MTWPTYPSPTNNPEILAHNRRGDQFAGKVYAAAVDVWRDGIHLYRSYSLENSESLDAWHARELGDDVARNDDDGVWRAQNVINVGDWPVPKVEAMEPVGSAKDLHNLLVTLLAIGQIPCSPMGLDVVPASGTLTMRVWRSSWPYLVVNYLADNVTLRAMITQTEVENLSDVVEYRAVLERRETREGSLDAGNLEPRSVTFSAPENADPSSLVRTAKQELDLTGWPAQRQGGTLVWNLARAPFTLAITRSDNRS